MVRARFVNLFNFPHVINTDDQSPEPYNVTCAVCALF